MINQNLGVLQRAVRLLLSLAVLIWVYQQTDVGPTEWLAILCAVFLALNALFGRCYLWFWLKPDACKNVKHNGPNKTAC